MLGVTFQNRGARTKVTDSPGQLRKKEQKVILDSPRPMGFGVRRVARRPGLRLVAHRSNERHPLAPTLKRACGSWDFRLGLWCYRLRQRARQRAALFVILSCATTIGWGLGFLP